VHSKFESINKNYEIILKYCIKLLFLNNDVLELLQFWTETTIMKVLKMLGLKIQNNEKKWEKNVWYKIRFLSISKLWYYIVIKFNSETIG